MPNFIELKRLAMMQLRWGPDDLYQYFDLVEVKMKERESKKRGTIKDYFKRDERIGELKSARAG